MTNPTTDSIASDLRRREHHRAVLIVAVGILVLSMALRVRDDQRVELRLFPGHPLPESCAAKVWLHRECPGCGLTRSFVHLASGDFYQSISVHRIGWLIAIAVMAQIPYRWILLRSRNSKPSPAWMTWICWLLIGVLIVNWLLNFVIS